MDTAAETLLIVVSTTLAVFLVFGSIALFYIIRVAKRADRLAEKAENIAGSVESAASAFSKAAAPTAFLKVVNGIISSVKGKGKD